MEKLSDHLVIDEGSSDDSLELEDPTENVSTGEKVQGILPYLFEPEESSDEEDHQNCSDDESDICLGQNENIEGAISRLGNDLWWCQCGACIEMIREKDCLCCREVEQILSKKFEGKHTLLIESYLCTKVYTLRNYQSCGETISRNFLKLARFYKELVIFNLLVGGWSRCVGGRMILESYITG